MKKPIIIIVGLLLVVGLGVGAWRLIAGRGEEPGVTAVPTPARFVETALEERPFISLIPSSDGHWLTIKVEKIQNATALEYELTYTTGDGLVQGAIGGPFSTDTSYEKKILLGTESSGHYRYHEGVERGSITIRLEGGPGPRKFTSDFRLQTGEDELVSADSKFSLAANFGKSEQYIIMSTVGLPGKIEGEVKAGPYGVFSSGSGKISQGEVTMADEDEVQYWSGDEWVAVSEKALVKTGVFVVLGSEEEDQ